MQLLVLGVEHANKLAGAGYSKARVKAELWEIASVAAAELSAGLLEFLNERSKRQVKVVSGRVHITEDADGIGIVVAGGLGAHSQFMPTLGFNPRDAATRNIRFPDGA